jgi:hypothetical protein
MKDFPADPGLETWSIAGVPIRENSVDLPGDLKLDGLILIIFPVISPRPTGELPKIQ